MPRFQRHIFVCTNRRPPDDPQGCCSAKGSEEIRAAFKAEIKRRKLKGIVRANAAGCLDACAWGVTVVVYPESVWYAGVTLADVSEIIDRHIVAGDVVERLLHPAWASGPTRLPPLQIPEAAPVPPPDSTVEKR